MGDSLAARIATGLAAAWGEAAPARALQLRHEAAARHDIGRVDLMRAVGTILADVGEVFSRSRR